MLTLRDVLGLPEDDPEVRRARDTFDSGPLASGLLADNRTHVYAKWQGAFWRLTALVELGVPAELPAPHHYLDQVLSWLDDLQRRGYPPTIKRRTRAHAIWHGHALAAAVALHRTRERRVEAIAQQLIDWQWPDGGWNCDRHPSPTCSSVHESLGAVWGLAAYAHATSDPTAGRAAQRAVEFFLERRLFKSRRTGEVIDPRWLDFRHPAYYHYNVLQAMWVLAGAGVMHDPRLRDAIELVASKRNHGGRWNANGRWWRPPGFAGPNVDAVDWGSSRPSELVTLKALTVLAQTGQATRDPDVASAG